MTEPYYEQDGITLPDVRPMTHAERRRQVTWLCFCGRRNERLGGPHLSRDEGNFLQGMFWDCPAQYKILSDHARRCADNGDVNPFRSLLRSSFCTKG